MIRGVAQVIMQYKRSDSIYTRQGVTIRVVYTTTLTSSFIMCGIIAVIYVLRRQSIPAARYTQQFQYLAFVKNQAICLSTCLSVVELA